LPTVGKPLAHVPISQGIDDGEIDFGDHIPWRPLGAKSPYQLDK
jgi:hypothetical protein